MTIEATCSKCRYLECYRDGFPGRVIVLKGTELKRKAGTPIEKCKMESTPEHPEVGFIRATGWAAYLPNPNPELTLEEDDKKRGLLLHPVSKT